MFGSFPPSLWLVCASKVYSGLGADIVYGIIAVIDPGILRGRGHSGAALSLTKLTRSDFSLPHTTLFQGVCMSIYRYADAFTIMRIMGHSIITLSQRYVHPTPETTEKAFDALELASKTAEERRSGGRYNSGYSPDGAKRWCTVSVLFSACPGGETGRRTGLKIPSPERDVPVRFRSRAPIYCVPSTALGILPAGSDAR